MKKFITFTSTIVIFAVAIATVSCTKNENLLEEVIPEMAIQSFASDSEMDVALYEVLSLSQEERIAKDVARGFKSFGTIAQKLYETIDPDQFKNLEEIKAFVEKHGKYLQLLPEGNGEYTLEVVAYRNPYRYLANENGEIKIGGSICKITEESVIDAEIGLIVTFSPFYESIKPTRKISETADNQTVETNQQLINSYFYATPTTGSNRLVVEFENVASRYGSTSFAILTHFRVQPYNRTMGIWFQCNRTLSMDIEFKGVLRIGVTNYPFEQNYTTTEGPKRTLGNGITSIPYTIPNASWSDNYQITTESYRFKGWSGSGNSREWKYKKP
jgi:hypothetical protein